MEQDNGASADADRATAASQSNPQAVSSGAGIPSAYDRDAILMEVAGWLEEGDFLTLGGIWHKRKRVREDAELRHNTSKEVRQRMADMIRGRMENKVGDPVDFLEDVKHGRATGSITGYVLRQAIALADKKLLKVCVITQVAGPWNNLVGGNTEYSITLTDEGEAFLAQAIEARSAMTAGHGPKGESAVRQDAPESPSHD